jgi:hypothetical protein
VDRGFEYSHLFQGKGRACDTPTIEKHAKLVGLNNNNNRKNRNILIYFLVFFPYVVLMEAKFLFS